MGGLGSHLSNNSYDPIAVARLDKRRDTKKGKILSLVRQYRKADKKAAVKLYKEIKLLLSLL